MGRTKEIFQQYREGEILLEDATILLREIRSSYEKELNEIKEFEHENLERYNEGCYKGFEFKVVNGPKTYDFSGIDDHNKAVKTVKDIEEKAKTVFEMYQTTGQRPITEDGELLELPKINYGKSYLKVTKLKQ